MRLGKYPCKVTARHQDGRVLRRSRDLGAPPPPLRVQQRLPRARCRTQGLVISGTSPDGRLVETVELPGRDFHLGAQFHPEFKSRPNRAHPLFKAFIAAALKFRASEQRSMMHM